MRSRARSFCLSIWATVGLAPGGCGSRASDDSVPDAGAESDPDADVDSDADAGAFSTIPVCQERALKLRAAIATCCTLDDPDRSPYLVEFFVPHCEHDHEPRGIGFDAGEEATCTATLVAAWEECVNPHWATSIDLWSCYPSIPLRGEGERCGGSDQCRVGECVQYGDHSTCEFPPGVGEACTDDRVCAADAFCTDTDDDGSGCRARVAVGDYCLDEPGDVEPCAEDAHCSVETGICERELSEGETCSPRDWCQGDTECIEGFCRLPPASPPVSLCEPL